MEIFRWTILKWNYLIINIIYMDNVDIATDVACPVRFELSPQ